MIDWEGLKELDAKTPESNYYLTIFEQQLRKNWPAILAQHEQDQRVIEAAKKLADQVVVYLEGGDTVALDAALAEFDRVKP